MSKRKKHTFTLSEAAKKKLVLNLPYCMIGLYATKLGQAWRMAEGADLSEKLLHLGDGFASAFASSLPSFHPADLLVGLLAGLLFRLAVYLKGKDAKKFRKGREYGSARWGTRKDIEPFIDPVFKNNILLTQTERLTMNSRPKDPRTARNKNVLVIGGSGSGKTRYLLKPNLMQCHSSYVITDPKGSLLIECGHLLEKKKYQIRFFNTINFKKSLHYNPFHYIHSEKDILKLANVLITNTDGGQKSGDPFWRNAEMLLYCALMGYIFYTQLFNLLCEKADDVYGGRLPVHVRCLIDECANIGQIPNLEKLMATIRSREISAVLIFQAQSQLKAIYKEQSDTIQGNCDSSIFLGGREATTLKELSAVLGRETIDTCNTGESRGRETSHSLNYQKLGKELMTQDELATMDGGKCILQIRGVRPFLSDKFDLTKHPNYKYLSDADPANAFDPQAYLTRELHLKDEDTFDTYEIDDDEPEEDIPIDLDVVMY